MPDTIIKQAEQPWQLVEVALLWDQASGEAAEALLLEALASESLRQITDTRVALARGKRRARAHGEKLAGPAADRLGELDHLLAELQSDLMLRGFARERDERQRELMERAFSLLTESGPLHLREIGD